LVICAVEAHLESGSRRRIGSDVIHRFEVGFGKRESFRLVDRGETANGMFRVIKILVVVSHVVGIGMGDRKIVRKFGGTENLALMEG
jgi:hypothetical protein